MTNFSFDNYDNHINVFIIIIIIILHSFKIICTQTFSDTFIFKETFQKLKLFYSNP